jgi:drug/metabolite transporter (DMT)-like permease
MKGLIDDNEASTVENQPLLPQKEGMNKNNGKDEKKTEYKSFNNTKQSNLNINTNDEEEERGDEDDDEIKKNDNNLVIYFLLMLVFALGNRIFGRLQVYPMHNYPLFVSNLSVVIYIPICFAYIIPILSYTNIISKEQTEIPKYKFAVMGYYDSIAGIMQTYAVNYITSASTVVLVQQSAIPISMVVSSLTLNSKYTVSQYIGATIVMSGIVFVLIPEFIGSTNTIATSSEISSESNMGSFFTASSSSSSSILSSRDSSSIHFNSSSISISSNSSELLWIAILVISCIPMCLSSVYKEKALGETEIDCTYLNGWVAIFQFLIAIPLMIPSATVQGIPVSNIIPNLYDGMLCWFGVNTITDDYNPYNQPLDNCTNAPLFVNLYLVFNVLYNFLIVIILKYGSANILWLASTMIVPMSNVVFSLKFIPNSEPMGVMDIVGLIVIMFGLVIYRFNNQLSEFYEYIIGTKIDDNELILRKSAKIMTSKLTRKQLPYIGINQIESLQTLLDTRIMKSQIQTLLYRSPRVIRENYLIKLGVSPSPQIAYHGPPTSNRHQQRSASSSTSSLSSPILKTTVKTAATTRQPFQQPPRRNLSLVEVKPRSNSMVSGNTLNFTEQITSLKRNNKGEQDDDNDNMKPNKGGGSGNTTSNNNHSSDSNSTKCIEIDSKFKSHSDVNYDSNV